MDLDLNARRNIAWAVNAIRPDWPRHSLITFLDRLEGRDARDVAAAMAWIALDPDTDKPGRVLGPGPWWPARDQPTPTRRYVTARPTPRDAVTGENLATRLQQARQALKTPPQPREDRI